MKIEKYKKDIDRLIRYGDLLYVALVIEQKPKEKERLDKESLYTIEKEVGNFSEKYQQWYSEALAVLQQVMPSRVDDFVSYYKSSKPRKNDDVGFGTYTLKDCLDGLTLTRRIDGSKVVGPDAAIPKLRQQVKIIESLKKTFESSLFDIRALLQADLFDNELDAAEELKKKGFLRAAGALAGVVLEAHLREVCAAHDIAVKKAKPAIVDYNEALKTANVIDVPAWRNIQFLADVRNLCDHKKDKEPKSTQVDDLIAGVRKVTKILF